MHALARLLERQRRVTLAVFTCRHHPAHVLRYNRFIPPPATATRKYIPVGCGLMLGRPCRVPSSPVHRPWYVILSSLALAPETCRGNGAITDERFDVLGPTIPSTIRVLRKGFKRIGLLTPISARADCSAEGGNLRLKHVFCFRGDVS